jgi:hypothetical protein
MFSDGAYLFDAGWLFFAAWSVVLLTVFVIAFGDDLLHGESRHADQSVKTTPRTLRSATSHTH